MWRQYEQDLVASHKLCASSCVLVTLWWRPARDGGRPDSREIVSRRARSGVAESGASSQQQRALLAARAGGSALRSGCSTPLAGRAGVQRLLQCALPLALEEKLGL